MDGFLDLDSCILCSANEEIKEQIKNERMEADRKLENIRNHLDKLEEIAAIYDDAERRNVSESNNVH